MISRTIVLVLIKGIEISKQRTLRLAATPEVEGVSMTMAVKESVRPLLSDTFDPNTPKNEKAPAKTSNTPNPANIC